LAAPWGVIEVIENDADKLVAVLEREGWSEAAANCDEEFDVS